VLIIDEHPADAQKIATIPRIVVTNERIERPHVIYARKNLAHFLYRFNILAIIVSNFLFVALRRPIDMRTNKSTTAVWITLLAVPFFSGAAIEPSVAQTSGNFDLKTFEGQTKFLAEQRTTPGGRKDKTISNFISEWRSAQPGGSAPASVLNLLGDDRLALPEDFRRPATPPDRTLWPLRGINRQEVAPDDARGPGIERAPPGPQGVEIRNALISPPEIARQKHCGDAVRSLRQKILVGNVLAGDRINNFHALCLFAGQREAHPRPLQPAELQALANCATAYDDYKRYCFAPQGLGTAADRLKKLAGVVVTKQTASNRRQIICSGLRVRSNLVLTARHCMSAFPASDSGGLWFYPLGIAGQIPAPIPVEQVIAAPNFTARPVEGSAQVYRQLTDRAISHNDVLLLKLAGHLSDPIQTIGFHQPTAMERVTLGGYQRLIFYAMLLKARASNEPLFDDEDLLNNGVWQQAFEFDASPTCLMMPYTPEEARRLSYDPQRTFGHMCQSLHGASGSVLVTLGASNEIVGVHIHARPDTELEARDIAVESVRPRNTAALVSRQLQTAIDTNR
jgi:hypothetical protein